MPGDRGTDEDGTDEEPGQPPTPPEVTVDQGPGDQDGVHSPALSGETVYSAASAGDVAAAESDGGEGKAAAATKPPKLPELPAVDSPDFDKRMREFAIARDARGNAETRPPDDETVTYRSITLAEVYVGRQADSLATALDAITWVDFPRKVAEEITEARKDDRYAGDNFIFLSAADPAQALLGHGGVDLPEGCKRIHGRYYVLGPSIVALVLTFVLADAEAGRLDAALRNDVEPDTAQSGSGGGVRTVYHVKYEFVHHLWGELEKRCLIWLKEKLPGTLVTASVVGVPSCSLVSLAKGRPFETQAEYMRLLELNKNSPGFRFGLPDYLYMTPSIGLTRRREYIAAFNEEDALAPGSYPDLSIAPETLHDEIAPYLVTDALEGVFRSFESRMRGIRSKLEETDFDGASEPGVPMARLRSWLGFSSATDARIADLRKMLLGLSRDIAIVSGDVAVVVETGTMIWRNYPWLHPVPKRYGDDRGNPADVARKDLRSLVTSIQVQEAGLRELVVVTSQAVSDVQNTGTQKRLNVLTIALVFLTLGLVFIGIVQIVETSSSSGSSQGVTSHTSTPASRPSLNPTPRSAEPVKSATAHGSLR